MPPSSDGGGGAAPERTPNARAVAIVDRVNPSYTHTLEWRRLRGVGYIEPNDELGQWWAVLSLQSVVAICWIVLERFEWSGNWAVITPNLPSFAPRVNSCRSGSVEEHGNDHGARTPSSWSASQCQTSPRRLKIGRCKATSHNRCTNMAQILRIKKHISTYIIVFFWT
jgi:hypothetical protein